MVAIVSALLVPVGLAPAAVTKTGPSGASRARVGAPENLRAGNRFQAV
jgi:hypothetical protein